MLHVISKLILRPRVVTDKGPKDLLVVERNWEIMVMGKLQQGCCVLMVIKYNVSSRNLLDRR